MAIKRRYIKWFMQAALRPNLPGSAKLFPEILPDIIQIHTRRVKNAK